MTTRLLLLCITAAALLCGCSSTPDAPAQFFLPDRVDHYGGKGRRSDYTLTLDLRFEKRPLYHQWVGMELALSAWQEMHGQRFVLERQIRPPANLFTYFKGLFSKSYHADVKTLVERRDAELTIRSEKSADVQRALARAGQVLRDWEKADKKAVGKYRWKLDPRIIYWSPDPVRGRFGFYRTHEGTLFFEPSGQVRTDTVVNGVEEIYRWHSDKEPDPVSPANFYVAISRVLEAFDPSPFPQGDRELLEDVKVGESWTASNTRSIVSFARGVVAVNQNLKGFINDAQQEPFEMQFKLARRDGDVDRIVSETTAFDGELGEGYRLLRFRRVVVYDRRKRQVLRDMLRLEAGSKRDDRIDMRLELKARAR